MDTFVQSGALRATINNVQLIELNTVRPLLPHALDHVNKLANCSIGGKQEIFKLVWVKMVLVSIVGICCIDYPIPFPTPTVRIMDSTKPNLVKSSIG